MRLRFLIPIVVLAALIAAFLIFTVGIYSLGWEGKTTRAVVNVVPYPVAFVGGKWIRISDYFENVRSQKQFYETQDFSAYDREIDFSSEEGKLQLLELRRVIFWRMIEDQLVRNHVEARGVVVSQTDVQQKFRKQLLEIGNQETIKKNVMDLYGWTLDDYRDRFAEPQIYQEFLEESLRDDPEIWNETKIRAQEVSDKLKRGGDFANLAEVHSDDKVTREQGGDLGVLRRGTQGFAGGQFDTLIFDQLSEGEVSGLLKSSIAYHILQVTERQSEDEVRVSHIVFYPMTFREWLVRESRDIRVNILLDDFQWDPEEFEVLFTNPEYDNIRDRFFPEEADSPFSSSNN